MNDDPITCGRTGGDDGDKTCADVRLLRVLRSVSWVETLKHVLVTKKGLPITCYFSISHILSRS